MLHLEFLDLPQEIRLQVYSYLLVVPAFGTPQFPGCHETPIYPQILAVCRVIHDEAKHLLYSRNTFIAHPTALSCRPRLRLYYDPISRPDLRLLIRSYYICLRLDCPPPYSAAKVQEAFTGVHRLTIDVIRPPRNDPHYEVLGLFEGVRGVNRPMVIGNVARFPEYAKWLQKSMSTPIGVDVKSFKWPEERNSAP
ncbi:uncharacterized protein BP5553_09400 [Venustampulla echinocandica]|uniref:F-box domain-containing protein n=1 Tax=Venustampulla echinocandica TaxID=2656787 RepID=A0A370TCM5_9HELO|nr:uncharacterized protein BP5553_09400 [Venustampulla echinocandica]RDL31998.1 hypothetical protein BP5553_09400 [Venustampulla echinocandica]